MDNNPPSVLQRPSNCQVSNNMEHSKEIVRKLNKSKPFPTSNVCSSRHSGLVRSVLLLRLNFRNNILGPRALTEMQSYLITIRSFLQGLYWEEDIFFIYVLSVLTESECKIRWCCKIKWLNKLRHYVLNCSVLLSVYNKE